MLCGGNLVRQPAFQDLGRSRPGPFRCVGPLPGANALKNHAIFVGVYPGLGEEQIDHIAAEIPRFVRSAR